MKHDVQRPLCNSLVQPCFDRLLIQRSSTIALHDKPLEAGENASINDRRRCVVDSQSPNKAFDATSVSVWPDSLHGCFSMFGTSRATQRRPSLPTFRYTPVHPP